MTFREQNFVYLPIKFLDDNASLTDEQLVTQLTSDLTGNTFAQGIIGILLKYRNPDFDTTSYQTDMDSISNRCIEFLLLRHRKLFDYVSFIRFFIKVINLDNLTYIYTILAYLVSQGIIYRASDIFELVLTTTNPYLTYSTSVINENDTPLSTNIIPTIQGLVYTSDTKCYYLQTTLNNISTSETVTVTVSYGMFLLYPEQQYTLSGDETVIMVDSPCEIDLAFYSADLSTFQYTSEILSFFQ